MEGRKAFKNVFGSKNWSKIKITKRRFLHTQLIIIAHNSCEKNNNNNNKKSRNETSREFRTFSDVRTYLIIKRRVIRKVRSTIWIKMNHCKTVLKKYERHNNNMHTWMCRAHRNKGNMRAKMTIGIFHNF